MAEITVALLTAQRASLVAQHDQAIRDAHTAEGALQLIDALLARLAEPEAVIDERVPRSIKEGTA